MFYILDSIAGDQLTSITTEHDYDQTYSTSTASDFSRLYQRFTWLCEVIQLYNQVGIATSLNQLPHGVNNSEMRIR